MTDEEKIDILIKYFSECLHNGIAITEVEKSCYHICRNLKNKYSIQEWEYDYVKWGFKKYEHLFEAKSKFTNPHIAAF